MPHKLLIYTQDPGGTRCLLPALRDEERNFPGVKTTFILHPLAEPIFRTFSYIPSHRRNVDMTHPLSVAHWGNIIEEEEPTHVLTTLSAPTLDPSNAHLVEAARKSGVPTLGLMDHWKGYERFYDTQGQARYFTDWLGCIDTFVFEEFKKRGITEERLHIVGQPGLEEAIRHQKESMGSRQELKILLVSQPETQDGSYRPLFFRMRNDARIIDSLVSLFAAIEGTALAYRPHPKERPAGPLPERISYDRCESTEEAIRDYDLFIGVDSTLLLQARLAGKSCLILNLPELATHDDSQIPYRFGRSIFSWNDLHKSILEIRESTAQEEGDLHQLRSALKGSTERCRKLIRLFLDNAQSSAYA